MKNTRDIIQKARELGLGIPAFNVAHLPMTEPIIRAVKDQDSFALVEVSRIDWVKFGAQSPAAVIKEFNKWNDPQHVRIHLDHVPVIDEDQKKVDYLAIIAGGHFPGLPVGDDRRLAPVPGGEYPARREVSDLAHRHRCSRRGGAGRGSRPRGGPAASLRGAVQVGTRVSPAPRRRPGCGSRAATGCRWPSATSTAPWVRRQRTRRSWRRSSPSITCRSCQRHRHPAGAARGLGHPARGHARIDEEGHRQGERGNGDPPGLRAGAESRRGRDGGAGSGLRPHRRPSSRTGSQLTGRILRSSLSVPREVVLHEGPQGPVVLVAFPVCALPRGSGSKRSPR